MDGTETIDGERPPTLLNGHPVEVVTTIDQATCCHAEVSENPLAISISNVSTESGVLQLFVGILPFSFLNQTTQ